MKHIFFFSICMVAFAGSTFCADTCACCINKKIITPASPRPIDTIVTVTCSALNVQWTGQAGQTFVFTAIRTNAATNKVIDTVVRNTAANSVSIPASPGTAIRWQIEAICTIDSRSFYSYPVRGGKDFIIPECATLIAAAKEKSDVLKVSGNLNNKVKVYPNPFQAILNIQFTGVSSARKTINIFDVNGRMISTQQTAKSLTAVNVKQLTPGTYIIRIQGSNGKIVYTGKVIKE